MRQAYKLAALTGILAHPQRPNSSGNSNVNWADTTPYPPTTAANMAGDYADALLSEDAEFEGRNK